MTHVLKFGGTSVEDASGFRRVARIVASNRADVQWIVVSACAGVTDTLFDLARRASEGERTVTRVRLLYSRHAAIAKELFGDPETFIKNELDVSFAELGAVLESVRTLTEVTPRVLDRILGFGEWWSSRILYHALLQKGDRPIWFDARKLIRTDETFGKAIPDEEQIKRNVSLVAGSESLIITQGFVGGTITDLPTTLGRGGSDYTASLLGAALEADEIQIWTDTDGILTADPKWVADPESIPELSYTEAAVLSDLGAKVIHPKTIAPAVRKQIPIRVLNSKNPAFTGTRIHSVVSGTREFPASITYASGLISDEGKLTWNGEADESAWATVSLVGDAVGKNFERIGLALSAVAHLSPKRVVVDPAGHHVTFILSNGDHRQAVRILHEILFESAIGLTKAAS